MEVFPYMHGDRHAISITLIGAGGTGSALMQHLARINKSMIAQGNKGIILTCIDDDKVSEANLGRQLFTNVDIGRSKSVVLVERMNRFFGTNWKAIPKKFDLDIIYTDSLPGNIIITCVDKVPVRKQVYNFISNCAMHEHHESYRNMYWIDTGNGKDFGQVILSSESPKTKNAIDLFPNMEEEEDLDDTPSCSLVEALDKQSLFINTIVAQEAAQLVWDLTQKERLEYTASFINLKKLTPIRRILL